MPRRSALTRARQTAPRLRGAGTNASRASPLLGDQTTLDKIDGAVAQPVIIAVGDASCAERAFLRIMARVVSRRGRSFASVAMMAGAAAARFGFGWTAPPVHLARGHAVLLVALGCAGAGALTGARRLRAVRT